MFCFGYVYLELVSIFHLIGEFYTDGEYSSSLCSSFWISILKLQNKYFVYCNLKLSNAWNFFGDSLALIAAVFYAGYILSIKDLTNVIKPAKTLYYVTLVTSLCLLPLSFIEAGTLSISYDEFILLLIYALFSQTIAQGLITKGISKVSAHLSSLVLLMQPVAAALYGWLLLGEMFTPTQIIGGIIVLLAIYLASKN